MKKPNKLILDKLLGDIPPDSFKKSHNKNLGIYEYAFYIHDYEYYLCIELWKKAIYTAQNDLEEIYKYNWALKKYTADKNLKHNIKILSTYSTEKTINNKTYRIIKTETQFFRTSVYSQFQGLITANIYYWYYYWLGNPKPYKLGNKI